MSNGYGNANYPYVPPPSPGSAAGLLAGNISQKQVRVERGMGLPSDSEGRLSYPMAVGCLDYFPDALAEVSRLSIEGNRKHCGGYVGPDNLTWNREVSTDHANQIMRHLAERDRIDSDNFLHDVKVAWRALAMLQIALEKRGAAPSRAARWPNREVARAAQQHAAMSQAAQGFVGVNAAAAAQCDSNLGRKVP